MAFVVRNKTSKSVIRKSETAIAINALSQPKFDPIGLDNAIEIMEEMQNTVPAYNKLTQKVVPTQTESGNTITYGYNVVTLTQAEIDANAAATNSFILQNNTSAAYKNGSLVRVNRYWSTGTTAGGSGVARFYLTDDHTATGNAIFLNNVFIESISYFCDDPNSLYKLTSITVATSKKYLDATLMKPGGILAGLLSMINAPNGISVNLQVSGN